MEYAVPCGTDIARIADVPNHTSLDWPGRSNPAGVNHLAAILFAVPDRRGLSGLVRLVRIASRTKASARLLAASPINCRKFPWESSRMVTVGGLQRHTDPRCFRSGRPGWCSEREREEEHRRQTASGQEYEAVPARRVSTSR